MSLYETCSSCKGAGTFDCTACKCAKCSSSGTVPVKCQQCSGGTIPCQNCSATGRVVVKKGFFSDKYGPCWKCSGSGRSKCSACTDGVRKDKCPACGGSGRDSRCAKCGGTGKIKCATCGGSRTVEGEWIRSLRNLPVDRLKFEYQKRENELSRLQRKMAGLERENEEWKEWYEGELERLADSPSSRRGFIEEGHSNAGIWEDIGRVDKEMQRVQAEMEAIDNVLSFKWK